MFQERVIEGGGNLKDFTPLFVGLEDCKPNHKYGPHIREFYLIHFVLDGKGVYKDKYGTHPLGKGELFVIRPEEVTVYQADEKEPWTYSWIYFTGEAASIFGGERSTFSCPVDLLNKLRELNREECVSAFAYSSFLHELAYRLFSSKERKEREICKIKRYVDYNYAKDVKVEEIAKTFGFDRAYVFKMFKKEYGCGLKDYVTKTRLEKAKTLLKKGYSVSDTAFMVGYKDAFNFSKAFKNYSGLAPREYAKSRRVKDGL